MKKREKREAAQSREVKVQPKEEVEAERDVRRTVRIITEVWMKVGIKKLNSHESKSPLR